MSYDFISDSHEILNDLLKIYQEGRLRPLPFFPKSSFSYCEEFIKGKPQEKCLEKARVEWLGSDYHQGECLDRDLDYCFGRLDPLDDEFVRLTLRIVEPIIKNESKV